MPFQATGYVPQYGDRIAELMLRQGEIAARGAERSGMIWGNAINQLGQIAGNAVEKHQAEQQVKTRGAAFQSLLADGRWQTDPSILLAGATKIYGPEHGPVIAKAAWEWSKITGKGDAEDEKRIGHTLVGLGRMTDAEAAPLWPGVLQKAVPWMKNRGIDATQVPAEWTPGMGPKVANFGLMLTGEAPATPPKPAGELVETVDAQGNPIKRRATEAELSSPSGVPVWKKPDDVKQATTINVGGRVMQFNPKTGKNDIDLGPSEGALGREAALIARAQSREEKVADKETVREEKLSDKAKAADEAKKENDSMVNSAFAAMEGALKEVEAYSGSSAVTSPLEAANARQQYLSAANAFAATLSRATGDTRISDSDRRAYGGLLAYSGKGSNLLMVARPDLVRKRLEEAKTFFDEASKARGGGGGAAPPPPATTTEKSKLLKKYGF
jgi:hypothetical protein